MASSSGRTASQKKKSTGTRRNTGASQRNRGKRTANGPDGAIRSEIVLIVSFAAAVLLFLCNFGIIGPAGDAVSGVLFGIFGVMAYAAPVLAFLAIAFGMANRGEQIAFLKLAAGVLLFLLIGVVCELVGGNLKQIEVYRMLDFYEYGTQNHAGGGALGGSLAYLLYHFLDMAGTALVVLVLGIICTVLVTEKSFVSGVKKSSRRVYETAKEESDRRKERAQRRREEIALQKEQEEQERILRMDKKVSGVMLDTTLEKEKAEQVRDDIHEIILNGAQEEGILEQQGIQAEPEPMNFEKIRIHTAFQTEPDDLPDIPEPRTEQTAASLLEAEEVRDAAEEGIMPETEHTAGTLRPRAVRAKKEMPAAEEPEELTMDSVKSAVVPKKYRFPSLNLLHKGENKNNGDSTKLLKETALRLQQTLQTFSVKVTVTDISQGPAVTRYELQPEPGVKVSKIVNLADDIKLNLAATDIRIEAPIPGKSAVGIEVPNKENAAVALRDLLERKEFKEFPSNIAFAVGKDIGGQVVVADIGKMPHMLIAGATGSGKSVCINTLIMSILYKAHPDDVKLIMIDPKVVELSVYNGIPHLLIPVVTDPKKAAAALHWGVAEMTERYKRFADYNVRDLKGYNKKVEGMKESGDGEAPAKMPQIVIIVDELADLMMVAPGEVEESICRLAQLARAAGIHLIIATQRPSVDVITGLIKANMPSRVAFAVSSGVDSRTILDMNGAEKLLGKGDMLFYPQGYPKPARIQGAFVSDKEVSDVVDFLKNQTIGNLYREDVEEKIQSIGSAASGAGADGGMEVDAYFAEAGRFIIDKDKASIGMLQRVFKIGFNRAARIMDQLCEAGVVGEEEGTKPRKVLMSQEQFEQYIEECL